MSSLQNIGRIMKDRWSFLQFLVSTNAPVDEIADAARDYNETCRLYMLAKG